MVIAVERSELHNRYIAHSIVHAELSSVFPTRDRHEKDTQGKMKVCDGGKVQVLASVPPASRVALTRLKIVTDLPEPNLSLPIMSASTEYISASVNRYNHAAACNSSSLIAFGSGNFVALWNAAVCLLVPPVVQAVN